MTAILALLLLLVPTIPRAGADEDPRPPGRIAFVDNEGHLVVVRPDGTKRRDLGATSPVQPASLGAVAGERGSYAWPTWAPDGRRLLAFHGEGPPDERVGSLFVFDARSGKVLASYRQPGLRPIYASWAPDGEKAAVLLQDGEELSLVVWETEGRSAPREVARGVPMFFDWRKDSEALLLHRDRAPRSRAGHVVTLLDLETAEHEVLSSNPALFGPAQWSADAERTAWGEIVEGPAGSLRIGGAAGEESRSVLQTSPHLAFLWSPNEPLLAATTSDPGPRTSVFEELRLVDVRTGESDLLREDTIDVFFWSPGGDRLLYARRDVERREWGWIVVDVETGKAREIAAFFPSREAIQVAEFFDQYALSHRRWSPDGSHVVFTGAAVDDPTRPDPFRTPRVYVVPADGSKPPQAIGEGHSAFWSPQ